MRGFNHTPRAAVLAVERAVLIYAPIWMGIVATVMLSGVLGRWGDLEHLLLGLGLAAPICLLPLVDEKDKALADRHATRYALFVVGMTAIQMYAGSWLFFDRLGMRYKFHVTWSWNRSPVFLYPLNVAYFATYYVVLVRVLRALPTKQSSFLRVLSLAVLSYALAFAETSCMAVSVLQPYFEYADKAFMLRWGSICYGTVFFVSLPLAVKMSEEHLPLRRVALELLARNAVVLLLYELYGLVIARTHR